MSEFWDRLSLNRNLFDGGGPKATVTYFRHMKKPAADMLVRTVINYHDLTLLLDGEMDYTIDGEKIALRGGEALYCARGTERVRRETPAPVEYISINFTLEPEHALSLPKHFRFGDCGGGSYESSREAAEMIALLKRIYASDHPRGLQKCSHVLMLLIYFLLDITDKKSVNPYVESMKAYIAENWRLRPGVEAIAEAVGLHPVYCNRLFREHEGVSINRYIDRIRMEKVLELFGYRDMSVGEIAEKIGFSEYYFCRWFKKYNGLTPSAYRRGLT